ncbi:MAG: hypothetical protein LUH36_05365 [Oscillospiraceae bacterium]|nr:hypothetical protein [Oscillospiraceae bacterium]
MKIFRKILCIALPLMLLMCLAACGNNDAAEDEAAEAAEGAITLSEEDEALLEEFGDDLHVIDADGLADFAASLDESYVGQVYQVTGYYISATSEDETVDLLCDSMGEDASMVQLRYLTDELTSGSQYTVTGVVALEEHGTHTHIVLDVVTVESYAER